MAKAFIKNGILFVNGRCAVIPHVSETWLRNQPEGTEAFVKDELVSYGVKVKNGEAFSNTGYADIVLTKEGIVKPVIGYVHKGYMPDRHSYQCYESEDICLRVIWGHGDDPKVIWECVPLPNGQSEVKPWDYRIPLPMMAIEWLTQKVRGASYLV